MSPNETQAIKTLKRAFADQRLTLFLGAGVSVANGLPTWEKLVLSLYFATISEQNMRGGWRPFANYLYAISEWYLKRSLEPLEITARKVKSLYKNDAVGEAAFLNAVRDALYGVNTSLSPHDLAQANTTLAAVVKLCAAKRNGRHGVRSVISYNYDSLLEMALQGKRAGEAVYSKSANFGTRLPIFHVHGYVPYNRPGTRALDSAIIFTEAEYNTIASDPYSWSNIVQLREMSSNVGLMIGLSLSDRNIRRLLDALGQSPVRPQICALLKKPNRTDVTDGDADAIHAHAIAILRQFENSGIKSSRNRERDTGFRRPTRSSRGLNLAAVKSASGIKRGVGVKGALKYQSDIREIIDNVDALEQKQQHRIFEQLGIVPIWYQDHDEIPRILGRIV
jgi:hypothetical protein